MAVRRGYMAGAGVPSFKKLSNPADIKDVGSALDEKKFPSDFLDEAILLNFLPGPSGCCSVTISIII